jgi:hypothetical protein
MTYVLNDDNNSQFPRQTINLPQSATFWDAIKIIEESSDGYKVNDIIAGTVVVDRCTKIVDHPTTECFTVMVRYVGRRKAKPAIYLYPTQPSRVSVQLGFQVKDGFVYPPFSDGSKWLVDAKPNGDLVCDTARTRYLFWEGETPSSRRSSHEGFNVTGDKAVEFLERTLPQLGLNEAEVFDFIVFWGPQLARRNYTFVWFETTSYAARHPLIVYPKPVHRFVY